MLPENWNHSIAYFPTFETVKAGHFTHFVTTGNVLTFSRCMGASGTNILKAGQRDKSSERGIVPPKAGWLKCMIPDIHVKKTGILISSVNLQNDHLTFEAIIRNVGCVPLEFRNNVT